MTALASAVTSCMLMTLCTYSCDKRPLSPERVRVRVRVRVSVRV